MTVFLETKRLIIKPPALAYLELIHDLNSDPDVMKFININMSSKEVNKEWLEKSIAHQQKHGFSFGVVFEKASSNFVGRAGLMFPEYDDKQLEIEIGYRLLKQYWNRGYATELAKAIIDWGFTHLKIEKLIGVTDPQNQGSRRVLEKVGMQYVGKANYYNNEVVKYEIYKDDLDISNIKL